MDAKIISRFAFYTFALILLIGCGKQTNHDFSSTLMGKENTFLFRGLTRQMTWDEIVKKENIDVDHVEQSLFKKYEYKEPIYFEELEASLLIGFDFSVDGKLDEAEYIFYTDDKEEMNQFVIKLGEAIEKIEKQYDIKPDYGSTDEIKTPPEYNVDGSSKKWEHKASDGSMLRIWTTPRISRIIIKYWFKFN